MVGTDSPVQITKIFSIVLEKDCGIHIPIVAYYVFVGQPAGFKFLLVYFHICIDTATVRLWNLYYGTTADGYSNLISKPWYIQLVCIALHGKMLRFLDRTICDVDRHVDVGDFWFVMKVSYVKVELILNLLVNVFRSHQMGSSPLPSGDQTFQQ